MLSLSELIAQSSQNQEGASAPATGTHERNEGSTISQVDNPASRKRKREGDNGGPSVASPTYNFNKEEKEFIFKTENEENTTGTPAEQDDAHELYLSDESESEQRQHDENYVTSIEAIYSQGKDTSNTLSTRDDDGIEPSAEYLQNVQSVLAPVVPRPFAYYSKLDRLQPQAHKVRNKITRKRELVLETTEEAQQRFAREQRQREVKQIKRRWSKRKVTFEDEIDHGKAIYQRAKRLMAKKLKKAPKSQTKGVRFTQEIKLEENKADETEYMSDESAHEQQHMLKRFSQPSTKSTKSILKSRPRERMSLKELNAFLQDANSVDPHRPLRERMDYWQYGKSVPDNDEIPFPFNAPPDLRKTAKGAKFVDPDEGCDKKMRIPVSKRPVVPGGGLKLPPGSRNTHFRAVQALIFQHLSGAALNMDPKYEDELISVLFSKAKGRAELPLCKHAPFHSYQRIATQQGTNALEFFKYTFSQQERVARDLGFLQRPGEPSIYAGRNREQQSLARRLSAHRAKTIHKYKLKRIPWTATAADTQREEPELEATLASGTDSVSLDKTDIGGSDAAIGNNQALSIESSALEQEVVGDSPILPMASFAHIPGTSPSIPAHPLNAAGIVFGPIDRHASHYQQQNHVNDNFFGISLNTLVARCANTSDLQHKTEIQEQIGKLLDEYAETTTTNIYKLELQRSKGKLRDIPLVQYNTAIRSICSYWANGIPKTLEKKDDLTSKVKMNDEDSLYSENDVDSNTTDTCAVAAQIADFCEDRVRHNGLQRFPKLRITYALAALSRSLPERVAQIIARPLDSENYRTPIQIFRAALEFMEGESLLAGNGDEMWADLKDSPLEAGVVEYSLHSAAEQFGKATESNPLIPEYHLWRISALSASLLLCSGNQIQSKVTRFPSPRIQRRHHFVKETQVLDHEIRERLPKFDEVRLELAIAIKQLFALVKHQNSPRGHEGFCSLLEWGQVIALLAGQKLEDCLEEINGLYVQCRHKLVEAEGTSRIGCENLGHHDRLIASAMELEANPGSLLLWRKMAKVLGSIAIVEPTKDSTGDGQAANVMENTKPCDEHKWLRPTLTIDRGMRLPGKKWWGSGREWWLSGLFQFSKPKRIKSKLAIQQVLDTIERRMPSISEAISDSRFEEMKHDDEYELQWLPTKASLQRERGFLPSIEDRERNFSNILLSAVEADSTAGPENPSIVDSLAGKVSTKLEVLACKILICAHLFGIRHECITGQLKILMQECYDMKSRSVREDCDEFRVLLWFCSIGLDIPSIGRSLFRFKRID